MVIKHYVLLSRTLYKASGHKRITLLRYSCSCIYSYRITILLYLIQECNFQPLFCEVKLMGLPIEETVPVLIFTIYVSAIVIFEYFCNLGLK